MISENEEGTTFNGRFIMPLKGLLSGAKVGRAGVGIESIGLCSSSDCTVVLETVLVADGGVSSSTSSTSASVATRRILPGTGTSSYSKLVIWKKEQ